ncbi:50S ribosomal protein L9 [Sunxiuqinia sp. sy24]|uniref:50S ribosomal protein L9 n=1 Tax=Sunxiuqinia sp. sy24 TaxID=3461495 RepID=UPI0040453386
MEIILLQDIQNLGSKDDLVNVKDGYGRNFLIPSKMAIVATESAKKVLAENIRQRAHKEAKLKDEALAIAEKLQNKQVVIATKTSTTGKIFGSVNTIQLAEAINKKGFEIDRKQIKIAEDSIKEIGKYTAKIKLHKEVVVDFEFEVITEE